MLLDIARKCRLDVARFIDDLDGGRYHRVLEESGRGWNILKVRGSPTLVLPSGEQRSSPGTPELLWDADEHVVGIKASEYPESDSLNSYRAILHEALA